MNKKEDIDSITNELKNLLIKVKKEIKQLKDKQKKVSVHSLTKKEYQTLYDENAQLEKKITQYEQYVKSQNIQKKRNGRIEKEKKAIAKGKNNLKNINFRRN